MKIAVVGGGPGGLYFSALWKRRHSNDAVHLFEQRAGAETFGFGVVFSDRALDFLRDFDPDVVELIHPVMEVWNDIRLNLRGQPVVIDGIGFSAIGRLQFLDLLHGYAMNAGVALSFKHPIKAVSELDGFDLIVAADGVNSLVRRSYEGEFGTSSAYLDNKFAWYGTSKRYEALTQTFVESQYGPFNAHHYRYRPDMSTFIVECDRSTWLNAGFDRLSDAAARGLCEQVFAEALEGHPLVSNHSVWRNFPWIYNRRWAYRNMVLLGDALHTAHYSIGSGTRLALEDAVALVKALEQSPRDLPQALAQYEAARRPAVDKLLEAARASARWYEDFATHMEQALWDFAFSYITRSGRVHIERLRAMAPKFMQQYETVRSAAAGPSA